MTTDFLVSKINVMKSETLTARQKEVLNSIYNSFKESGYPPTLADLRDRLGVSSNQAVLDFLKLLEEKGYIKREEGMARGLKILKKAFDELNLQRISPYVGVTAAGPYIEAIEALEWKASGDVEISGMYVKVKGDSMINAGIKDGDIVVVEAATEFKSGDIVLARSDDGTTVKRLIHDDGNVYLKAENPKHKNSPIYPGTRLIGKVVKVLKGVLDV